MRVVGDGETAEAKQDAAAQEMRLAALGLAVEFCTHSNGANQRDALGIAEQFRTYIETGELPA